MSLAGWVRGYWYALVPAVAALALGLWGIDTPGPWLDERFTIEAVTDGLETRVVDAPMYPYYLLMWLWTGSGSLIDAGWLRLPSVLAVVAGSALVALTARRLSTVQAGFAAGMLFAMAPGVVRYAQEARTYAMAAGLVALATYVFVRAATGSRRWWVGYAVVVGAAGLLLPVTLAVLPAHMVMLTTFPDWRSRLRDFVGAWLLLIPLIVVEALMGLVWGGTRDWLEPPGIADLARGVTMIGDSEWTGTVGQAFALVLVVLAALTPLGLRWLAGLAASVVVVFVVSVTLGSWWIPRSFVPLTGILCVAAGLALAKADWTRVLVVLGVLAVVALPSYRVIKEPGSRGTDPRALARILDEEGRLGDHVRVPAEGSLAWWAAQHYLPDDARFTSSPTGGSGRYWELGEDATCTESREWQVTGGGVLRLCL